MNSSAAAIDAVFIGKQQQELLKLRAALVHAAQADEDDEGDVRGENRGGPREYEDDAQKLALLEVDGNRVVRNLHRLSLVNRALAKIAEGTYGLSDVVASRFRGSDSKWFPKPSARLMKSSASSCVPITGRSRKLSHK